jgi:predicted DNA-binding transcriptional regulator AlpA
MKTYEKLIAEYGNFSKIPEGLKTDDVCREAIKEDEGNINFIHNPFFLHRLKMETTKKYRKGKEMTDENVGPAFHAKKAWKYLGIRRALFYELVAEGRIKPPIVIASFSQVWLKSDLDAFLFECINSSRPESEK